MESVFRNTCLLAAGAFPERLYGVVIYVVSFVFLIGLLILVHEWGHCVVARLTGMLVEEFWVGMPFPPIRKWKRDTMTVGIGAIPLGGYVKITGMNLEDGDHPDGFNSKPLLARIAVLLAGPAMNLVAAALIYIAAFNVKGITSPAIQSVDAGRPAAKAGLKPRDQILEVDGVRTIQIFEVMDLIKGSRGRMLSLLVSRGNKQIKLTVQPEIMKRPAIIDGQDVIVDGRQVMTDQYGIGIVFDHRVFFRRVGFVDASRLAVTQTYLQSKAVLASLYRLPRLLIHKPSQTFAGVGGPVSILKQTGESAKEGAASYFAFMAFLSINLALFNLLPWPALDGGRILISVYGLVHQAIFRQPFDRKKEFWVNAAGMAFLLLFIIVVSAKDLKHWILG